VRAGLRWLAAVLVGAGVFEGLDLLGSSPSVSRWIPGIDWLPTVSPLLAGGVAAWTAGPGLASSLLAAAGAVWARIGLDRGLGVLRGVSLPAEVGMMLVVAFGIPWTGMALAGGGVVALLRALRALRRA
jgi:hypothetical protein